MSQQVIEHTLDQEDEYGMTGLMIACEAGKIEMARLLLDARADPTIKNNEGESALDLAKKGGYTEIVSLVEKSLVEWDDLKDEIYKRRADHIKAKMDCMRKIGIDIKKENIKGWHGYNEKLDPWLDEYCSLHLGFSMVGEVREENI